jgi:FMN-dependent NADH-azoreductase
MKLLHVDSSILSRASVSRRLSAAIVETIRSGTAADDFQVVYRDLASMELSHINGMYLGAMNAPEPPVRFEDDIELGRALLAEFMNADVVVIGSAMYNFTISSQLKAWIDRIVIAGKTFRYTGPGVAEGLASGKRVYIAMARGDRYAGGAAGSSPDFQEPYLRAIFAFMGVSAVTFVSAEGLLRGEEEKAASIEAALATARAIAL